MSKRIWWLVGIVVGLPLAWVLYQIFAPNEQIEISPETTVLTEPLRADGLPDYAQYFYELGHEGVTPENNGAVEFWQAMWPGDLAVEDWHPLCDALGMKAVPKEGSGLESPYTQENRAKIAAKLTELYQQTLEGSAGEDLLTQQNQTFIKDTLAHDAIGLAMERPWKSAQLPALAEWLERNSRQLDLLVAATEKPKFWSPLPSMIHDRDEGLIALLLPNVQSMRMATRVLNIRAMWHLGMGDNQAAWTDLKACYRLAQFTSAGPTLVEQLVAIAMEGIANQQTVTLLDSGHVDAKLASRILGDLTAMGPACDIANSVDTGERLLFVDTVLRLATGRDSMAGLTGGGGAPNFDPVPLMHIKWNYVLREGNLWYDRLVAAARLPTRDEKDKAIKNLDFELRQMANAQKNPYRLLSGLVSRQARSEIFAEVMASLFLPALRAAYEAEVRAEAVWELTRLAAALAVYRAERGEYPEQLTALVPGILPEVPLDLYVGEPFRYERKPDGGYLLYSVYRDGKDDGGTSMDEEIVAGEWMADKAEIDSGTRDIVFRVPVPEFKLPELPVEEDLLTPPGE
ncbi:hypothetical protein [Bythopirellula goksoeyrii]|nr:hypothetical protein [Bythopirellula goksoeyrii]